jgi:hypothetical protein
VNPAIFLGPTLSRTDAAALLPEATFCSPAACGDVYRAARRGHDRIGIIDGFFEQKLAVWHKEILWALSQGVRVYGAASMGALRAAELADFGMVGVGQVFTWFRQGVLEDDDEVAIVHEPAERNYAAASEAMVNIRATLARAERLGVIDEPIHLGLLELAKSRYYPLRTFRALLAEASLTKIGGSGALSPLLVWLEEPAHHVDVKRQDAEALLVRIAKDGQADLAGPQPSEFSFEYTEAWHELVRRLEGELSRARAPASAP